MRPLHASGNLASEEAMDKRRFEAERWLNQAEEDLATARDLIEKRRFNWACFVAQQAAEKAIKAIYQAQAEIVEWVHSLAILIKGDSKQNIKGIPVLAELYDEARELDKVYIPSRYPNALPHGIPSQFYSKEDGEKCIRVAEKIIKKAKTFFKNM